MQHHSLEQRLNRPLPSCAQGIEQHLEEFKATVECADAIEAQIELAHYEYLIGRRASCTTSLYQQSYSFAAALYSCEEQPQLRGNSGTDNTKKKNKGRR